MKVDVLVAGGGSAGLAAAISAARLGARTLLVERAGVLGGMAPGALVHSICGLYELPHGDTPPAFANDGFAREFAERLLADGGAHGPLRMGRVDVLLQQPTAFAVLADTLAQATPGLTVRLHTDLIEVAEDLSSVDLLCHGQRERIRPRALVDTTGDGNLAALAGAEFEQEPSARLQRPAFIFALGAVQPGAAAEAARLRIARRLVDAVKTARLPPSALGVALRESGHAGEVFITIDLAGGLAYQPTDPTCLRELEMEGRALAAALAAFLREEVDGFATSFISAFPARLGVRESRRILGRYRLTAEDLLTGAAFPDAIAAAAWPMEMRETHTGPRLRYPAAGRAATIPLRTLRARDHDRLFVAGRCLSCTHEAQASIRVMGTCLATGEAAGFAAALAAAEQPVEARAITAAREHLRR